MSGPRFSIIPGDFATDVRADVAHFRVLNIIGRHTDEGGWCKLKQITIGEAVGLTRETVNRKIKDLVEWGYVQKQEVDRTGRAIEYRTIIDPPTGGRGWLADPIADSVDDVSQPDAQHVHGLSGPVSGGSHVGYNPEAELHPTCDRTDHSRCDRTQSQQERLSNEVSTPLPPQAGDSADFGFEDQAERQTASAKAETALAKARKALPGALAIDAILAPLIAQRRFSAGDVASAFREILSAAADLPAAHLAKVLELVLAADVQTVKPQRVLDAIEAVRKGGLMLVVTRGSQEFAAWQRHYERQHPNLGAMMARSERWQVPSPFPPSKSSEAA